MCFLGKLFREDVNNLRRLIVGTEICSAQPMEIFLQVLNSHVACDGVAAIDLLVMVVDEPNIQAEPIPIRLRSGVL